MLAAREFASNNLVQAGIFDSASGIEQNQVSCNFTRIGSERFYQSISRARYPNERFPKHEMDENPHEAVPRTDDLSLVNRDIQFPSPELLSLRRAGKVRTRHCGPPVRTALGASLNLKGGDQPAAFTTAISSVLIRFPARHRRKPRCMSAATFGPPGSWH
jgi:hypothetical protein